MDDQPGVSEREARADVPGLLVPVPRWRVGRSVGLTVYLDDVLVGLMDTPGLAAQVVEALNANPGPCPACGGHDPLDGRQPVCRCGSDSAQWQ